MSGDFGLRSSVPACLSALSAHPDLEILLVGDQPALQTCLRDKSFDRDRLHIVHASQVIGMDEKPSQALRHKTDASMRIAIDQVADGNAAAAVSAGNTGALMAIARYRLGMLDGIDRPAICVALPVEKRIAYLLDLGANVDCSPQQLLQFALMGSALVEALHGNARPRVALLNIGAESNKGNEQVRAAAQLLTDSQHLNYSGFVEASELFGDRAEVIVCDGFVGNIALKACEGTARYVGNVFRAGLSDKLLVRLLALPLARSLRQIGARLDPARYNGASLLGLRGVVIKSHGNSCEKGFTCAIERARQTVQQDVLGALSRQFAADSACLK